MKNFKVATRSATNYAHTAICNEYLNSLNIPDTPDESDEMDEETVILKHGHNNPVEAVQFMEKAMKLVDRFMDSISGFVRYKLQDAYLVFLHDLH